MISLLFSVPTHIPSPFYNCPLYFIYNFLPLVTSNSSSPSLSFYFAVSSIPRRTIGEEAYFSRPRRGFVPFYLVTFGSFVECPRNVRRNTGEKVIRDKRKRCGTRDSGWQGGGNIAFLVISDGTTSGGPLSALQLVGSTVTT